LPLRIETQARGGDAVLEALVWGRRYRFERGPLPQAIESQGTPLFVEAPRFVVRLGGQEHELRWTAPKLENAAPARADLSSEARLGEFFVEARTRIEYDGMLRVDLILSSKRPQSVEGFAYELSLPASVARHFNHHVPYDYASLRIDKQRLLESAGFFPEVARRFDFVPTLFVGNRRVGIEWWSESNLGWSAPSGHRPLELRPGKTAVRFRVEPLAAPLSLSPESSWTHTFALFPTPMREPPPGWRSTRFTPGSQARRYDRSIGTRFVWIAFPGHFDARWHGLPASRKSKEQRALRERLQADQVSYVPYAKLTAVPSLHPKALENAELWSATQRLFTGPGGGQRKFLEARGWKPGSVYGYAACIGRMDYLDWMLEESLATFRSERLGGLYYDWGAIHEPCRRDPRIRNPKREQVWHYFNLREFYKRLFAVIKAENPEAVIAIHTQGQPRALAAFVDYVFVGEALNVLFRGGRSFAEIRRHPELYEPDYFALPPGFLDAQLWPRVGGVSALLPEVHHARNPEYPGREREFTRAFFAITLVNDSKVWLTNTDPRERIAIFRAIDRFGGFSGSVVHPWWENSARIQRDPRLRVTAHVKPGRVLLIASNWSEEPLDSEIRLDPEALELHGIDRVRDAEFPGKRGLELTDEAFRTRIPPRDFRLFLLD
jgi:hypothetical protein